MEKRMMIAGARQCAITRPRGLRSIAGALLLLICVLAGARGALASNVSYKLPYPCGLFYVVTQGNNNATSHTGESRYAFDFGMPEGSQVVAAADGEVLFVTDHFTKGDDDKSLINSGNRVVMLHADGYCSLYLHLKEHSAVVKVGDRVKQGQPIALSGRTGYVIGTTGAHLHFQLQKKGIWWEQSVPVSFDDVPGGVPKAQGYYISGNCPNTRVAAPTLKIDGGTASQRRQTETFYFVGSGLTAGASAVQHVQEANGTIKEYSAVVPSSGVLSWSFTPSCNHPTGTYAVWVEDPYLGATNRVSETVLAGTACGGSLPDVPPTATILVMDVSGSMGERWKGGVKIDSAKEAALQFIEQVTNENRPRGGQHMIGIVAFSDQAQLLLPLTGDYGRARQVIISLGATNSTNLGDGLSTALVEFGNAQAKAQRLIILLSDGNSNTGPSKDQVLSGPVVEAMQKHVCIHTVAFGDPGDVDETFLRRVASGSGCGSYNLAQSGFELFSTFLKLRDASLGQVVGEYSSVGRRVTFLQGTAVALGTILIGSGQRELHLTLAWSADGTLQARLKDPSGGSVTASYPGAQIYVTRRFAHITVLSPSGGAWTIEASPLTQLPDGTEYYAVVSTRPGGVALPLPLPVFAIGDRTFALPAGLPTWLLVLLGAAILALAIYSQLSDYW